MGQEISAEVQQSGTRYITISTLSSDAKTKDPRETPVICHLKRAMKPYRDGPNSTGTGRRKNHHSSAYSGTTPMIKQIFDQPLALKPSPDH